MPLFASALLAVFLCACGKSGDEVEWGTREKMTTMAKLGKSLESSPVQNRLEPFEYRMFYPYLSGKWIGNAVSYGCYREGQEPGKKGPTTEEVREDLKIIAKYWNLVRVYNADDDTERILQVIHDERLPIRMMLGIWLENETNHLEQKQANIRNVLRGIELANRFEEIVMAISVGNETQVFWSGHRMEAEDLIRYIRAVRAHTHQPVTTADDYNFWNKMEAKRVAEEVDFLVTHIYPLWNGKTLDTAIGWMDSTFRDIRSKFPGQPIVLGETGWATDYNIEKKGAGEQGTLIKGEIGLAAQERYLQMHNDWVNATRVTTFLFEAFDEPWKGGGENSPPNEIEKHWGVFYQNRAPKESFENYLRSTR